MKNRQILFRDWLRLSARLLWCYEKPMDRDPSSIEGNILKYSHHRNSGAWLVRSGWARVEHDGETYTAGPGQWLIVKPRPRMQSFSRETVMLSIAFEARWPNGKDLIDEGLSSVLTSSDFPGLEAKAKDLLAAMPPSGANDWNSSFQPVSMGGYFHIQAMFHEWLSELTNVLAEQRIVLGREFESDPRVIRLVRFINEHPLDLALAPDGLCRRAGLSLSHLNRLFRKAMGCTPHAYFDSLRFEYARERIRMPGTRPSDVADELGFPYLSYFSRWFKKHSGKTPRAFVRSRRH